MEGRHFIHIWDQLMVKEGVLYRMCIERGNSEFHLHLIVPQILRETVLAELREGSTEGHLGQEKILGELKKRFYCMARSIYRTGAIHGIHQLQSNVLVFNHFKLAILCSWWPLTSCRSLAS